MLAVPKGVPATWTVNGFAAAAANTSSPACSRSPLPQDGNGLGLMFALVWPAEQSFMIRRVTANAARAGEPQRAGHWQPSRRHRTGLRRTLLAHRAAGDRVTLLVMTGGENGPGACGR